MSADEFASIPRDQGWLATLGTLAPVIATRGRHDWVRTLSGLLEPYRGRIVVVGQGSLLHGAVDHQLGLLASALGDRNRTRRHFEQAALTHEQLQAPSWVARSRDCASAQ